MLDTRQAKRAALWDVDGTLIDSRQYHWLSWKGALASEGFRVTPEQFASSFGRRNDEILRGYFPSYSDEEIARVGHAKEETYRHLVRTHGIELLPGVRRWLYSRRSKAGSRPSPPPRRSRISKRSSTCSGSKSTSRPSPRPRT